MIDGVVLRLLLAVRVLGPAPVPHRPVAPAPPERLVAEAPIWGRDSGYNGYAFLPVTIQGRAGTVVIDLQNEGDLLLSTAALARVGVTLAETTTTQLAVLTIGSDAQHQVPLTLITKPTWHVPGPEQLPPVVGLVGVHFLVTHYDLLYDFPHRIVRLYARPAHPGAAREAWLPPGFTPADCGRLIPIPSGAQTFTGVAMQLDGHPVTGVLEMGPYLPKINAVAWLTLGLPVQSPRLQFAPPGESDGGHVRLAEVQGVRMTIGAYPLGRWPVEVLQELNVQPLLPPKTPIMLLNLENLRHVRLFNAVSSGQVCVAQP